MAEWATYIEEHGEHKLVVVAAPTVEKAREASGLVFEEFHPATEEERILWDEETEDIHAGDVDVLLRLVGRELRALGRRRTRDRENGKTASLPVERDANRHKARRLVKLMGKLEMLAVGEREVVD